MRKFILLLVLLPFLSNSQIKIEGVNVPAAIRVGESTLMYNGGGVREKYFMDMYVGALYLKARSKDGPSIISANDPMAIHLHIVSGLITSEKMITAVDEGFQNSTGGKTSSIDSKIKQFKSAFSEKIVVGDIFDLQYIPNKGVNILKNNKLISTIPGLDFKSALFGIWLCNQPADSDLKEKMLGL